MTGVATDDDATGGKLEADGFTTNDQKRRIILGRKIQAISKMFVRIVC